MIWRLFKRSSSHKLQHLLCHGYERSASIFRHKDNDGGITSSIPGLVARHPNSHVHALKGPLWCRLHAALGEGGDRLIMDMLTECAIFLPVDKKSANYYQLSGPPLFDLQPITAANTIIAQPHPTGGPTDLPTEGRTPCQIAFVRSRMFYARAALNAKGGIRFGMRHIRWSTCALSLKMFTDSFCRCIESFPTPERQTSYCTDHEIHLSTPVRFAQRHYLEG